MLIKSRIVCIAAAAVLGAVAQPALAQAPAASDEAVVDVRALQAEVERLRSIVPGQAVAMTQVAYNFSNLWFAMHEQNWPLAQFYANETRVRLRWAMRITPTRKIASGEIELVPILEALEANELAALQQSVAEHDVRAFEAAYRATLQACSGCHAASEKPYLRLRAPSAPAEPLIEFDAD